MTNAIISKRGIAALAVSACVLLPSTAGAQETTNTPSATLPGKGRLFVLQRASTEAFERSVGGDSITETTLTTRLAYGIRRELALTAALPIVLRDSEPPFGTSDSDGGFGDAEIGVRYRFFRKDLGPLDTLRLATDFKLELPTGHPEFTSDSVDPSVSLNLNYIRGRQGFNAAADWKFTTGDEDTPLRPGDTLADRFRLHSAYVYRINPDDFDERSTGATYLQLELLSHAETNGDSGLNLAPGLLYEGLHFAAEASMILPIYDDSSNRAAPRGGFYLGVRFLF